MEAIVVQGPIRILKEISDKILSCKGVLSCKLTLTDVIIPQVHSASALSGIHWCVPGAIQSSSEIR